MHQFLNELKPGDYVESVYCRLTSKSDEDLVNTVSSNGNPYVAFRVSDNSLPQSQSAKVMFFYKKETDYMCLTDKAEKPTRYFKIKGVCKSVSPELKIFANAVIPAGDMVFDRGDLYAPDERFKNQILSYKGLEVNLPHTSVEAFQEDYDIIEVGQHLKYKRIFGSPHDRNQFGVYIEDIEEDFSIPAYVTPTMAQLYDDGYVFDITVVHVIPRDEAFGRNAGIRVRITGRKA